MKLLILTQKVDREDPILGFFCNWILELSKKFEKISVICLEKGDYDLPKNVQIFSLGKESGRSKIKYVKNFFNLILGLHKEYDSVFVHMNQEYILLGGFVWKILGKKVFFWRNHQYGNLFTRIAVWLSNKVFCTSKYSYTAKFGKTEIMPVGIDINKFSIFNFQFSNQERKNKVLSLGRISPVKNIHIMIEAAKILKEKNIDFVFDIVGDPVNPEDFDYKNKLVNDFVNFKPSVPNYKTPEIYRNHEIFVNLTESFDKTIIEAAVCGTLPIIANRSLMGEIDQSLITNDLSAKSVAIKLEYWLKAKEDEKEKMRQKLIKYVLENHSLDALVNKLCLQIL